MRFFNLDLHISVIADIKDIFTNLGHEVVDWSLSGHTWVMNKSKKTPKFINDTTWKSLSPELCDNFYEEYKDFLNEFDAFICTYPPAFSLLYEKTNKPIIMICPIRYEHPFTNDKVKWEWLNNYIKKGIDSGRIIPIANNKYDAEYFKGWINRDIEHIPSLCEYTKAKYNKQRDEYILFSRGINLNHNKIIHRDSIGNTSWENMYTYSGVIHLPYTCSTMSIFEQYTAGIPLYFPSRDFIKTLYYQYLDSGFNGIFYDLSFNRYYGLTHSVLTPEYSIDYNDFSSEEVLDKFIDLSDFYDEDLMPSINYFSSFDELNNMITCNIYKSIDNNKERKLLIYDKWKNILNTLINKDREL